MRTVIRCSSGGGPACGDNPSPLHLEDDDLVPRPCARIVPAHLGAVHEGSADARFAVFCPPSGRRRARRCRRPRQAVFQGASVSPGATRACFPPLRMTAYIRRTPRALQSAGVSAFPLLRQAPRARRSSSANVERRRASFQTVAGSSGASRAPSIGLGSGVSEAASSRLSAPLRGPPVRRIPRAAASSAAGASRVSSGFGLARARRLGLLRNRQPPCCGGSDSGLAGSAPAAYPRARAASESYRRSLRPGRSARTAPGAGRAGPGPRSRGPAARRAAATALRALPSRISATWGCTVTAIWRPQKRGRSRRNSRSTR